jgi:hypothetical protein
LDNWFKGIFSHIYTYVPLCLSFSNKLDLLASKVSTFYYNYWLFSLIVLNPNKRATNQEMLKFPFLLLIFVIIGHSSVDGRRRIAFSGAQQAASLLPRGILAINAKNSEDSLHFDPEKETCHLETITPSFNSIPSAEVIASGVSSNTDIVASAMPSVSGEVKAYRPQLFLKLRANSGVNEDVYLQALGTECLQCLKADSKSGQTFWRSNDPDNTIVVKSINHVEAKTLVRLLDSYALHVLTGESALANLLGNY